MARAGRPTGQGRVEGSGEVMVDTHSMYAYIRVASQNLKEAEDALFEVDKDELYKRLLGAHMHIDNALKELQGETE